MPRGCANGAFTSQSVSMPTTLARARAQTCRRFWIFVRTRALPAPRSSKTARTCGGDLPATKESRCPQTAPNPSPSVPGLTTKYVQRAQFRLCSRAASITTLRVNRLPLTAPHYRVAVQRKAADSEVPALRLAMAMVHVRINFGAGDMHASRGTQMDLPFPLS